MIKEDIAEWINTLPIWQQAIGKLIVENKQITDDLIEEIYALFKIEMSLEEGRLPDKDVFACNHESETMPNIKWDGVGHLHGVNRLNANSWIDVSEGLTVIYGENGSGKSGYTRLLNRAFVSRGDQDILPDIFSEDVEDPSAEFLFSLDNQQELYKYPDRKDELPFRTIRSFDSKSASSDMNQESLIDFAPVELSFFDDFLSVCTAVQKKLDEERASRNKDNPTLKFFPKEGKAHDYMEALSAKTDIGVIKETFILTEEDEELFEQIKKEKAKLIALDINKQIAIMNQVIALLDDTQNRFDLFAETVSDENIEIYNQQIEFLKKVRAISEADGFSLFEKDEIERIGTTEWKEFINAAKKYYDSISVRDRCPLCGQTIGKEDLIFKYWKYLESDAERNLAVAEKSIQLSIESIKKLKMFFIEETSIYAQWLEENFKDDYEIIKMQFKKAEEIIVKLLGSIENEVYIYKINIIRPDFQKLIGNILNKRDGLNQDAVNMRIEECDNLENEYEDRKRVIDLIPIISSYVEHLKWDDKAEKSRIKTRNITSKQKELFEKYVTDDYLKTFEEECKKLNADFSIRISSRGSAGQTLKKLQIGNTVPGKVLSEGEQKAISIANFLTEAQMDERNIGIVLDDPVSSLDHRRRSLIVKRLLDEARHRQVVIFTHEITFFIELKTEALKNDVHFEAKTIRSICNEPGNVSTLVPWPGMNVKERIGKLKNDLQTIGKMYRQSGETDDYFFKVKEWCELLRESWERAVEEILFNDAIQRFNPSVQTQRLRKAPFTQDLYRELEKGMTECSAWCHDQARAINGTIPSCSDLEAYIESLEKYYKQYRV